MVRRATAIIGEPIKLGYRYVPQGTPVDVPIVIKVEIWQGFPGNAGSTLRQEILADKITRTAVGTYEYLMDAVETPGQYYDRWFFKTDPDGLVQNDVLKIDVASTLEEKATCTTKPAGVGYTFQNYEVPPGEWGEIVTYDDIALTQCFGIRLQAGNGQTLSKEQVQYLILSAMATMESYFGIVIRRRKILTQPTPEVIQYYPQEGINPPNLVWAKYWREGVDYTHEDDAYEFEPRRWQNMGYLQMHYYPIIQVNKARLFSYVDTQIIDVLPWIRVEKKTGQLFFYPRQGSMGGGIYPFIGAEGYFMSSLNRGYPGGFKINYEAGYETSDRVPEDLRQFCMKLVTVQVLSFVGTGVIPGLASSSLSIDGISESVSTTQSSSSTLYGARIKQLADEVENDRKILRGRYSNMPLQFA